MIPSGIEYAAEELERIKREREEQEAEHQPQESDDVWLRDLPRMMMVPPEQVNEAIEQANWLGELFERGEGVTRIIAPIKRGYVPAWIDRDDLYKLVQEV